MWSEKTFMFLKPYSRTMINVKLRGKSLVLHEITVTSQLSSRKQQNVLVHVPAACT